MNKETRESPETTTARRLNERRAVSSVRNIGHPITARFGMALRARRKQLGLTQAALADATSLSRSYISDVERGRESISLDRAERLAQALDVHLADLLAEVGI